MGDSASERGIVGLPVERRRIVLPFYEHLCDTHVLTFQTRKGVFDVSGTASLLSSHTLAASPPAAFASPFLASVARLYHCPHVADLRGRHVGRHCLALCRLRGCHESPTGQSCGEPAQTQTARRGTRTQAYASSISPCPALTGTPNLAGSVDGLGTLGYYTLIKQNLDDRLLMATNAANGNLILQDNALQISGTGLNLDLTLTYNAQSSASGLLGPNWSLDAGNDVSLSFSNGNVTFHGPGGFSAPYIADSNSYGNYDEPPGMDATLLQSSVNGASYVLVYQHSSECLGFNSNGQEIFDQDKNGHQITFAYNGSGNLSSLTDTQNRLTTFGYNAKGHINLITDPIGRTVQLSYANGLLTSITDLNGKNTTFGYTGNDVTTITDPDSNSTSIAYQSSGNRVSQITDALNKHAYLAYYSQGANQCGKITLSPCVAYQDANNHFTIYGYSGLEVLEVIDGNGNMESTAYTPDANVSSYTDPLNDVTTFGFSDGNTNNLTSITDPTQAVVTYDYDNANPYLPNKVTDAQGNTISYTYDSNGNLLSASDTTSGGTGSSASYTYNTGVSYGSYTYGLLTRVKDGDGNTTSYSYDSYGNLQTVTPPSPLGQQSITVDGVSRLSTVTDGNGVTLSYSYDNLDRVTKLTYTKGTSSTSISYSYNDDGDQTQVVDNTGTTGFSYDKDNRLLIKTLPNSQQLGVTYDTVGNIATYTDSGGTVTYSYDAANRVTQVKEPDGAITTYGYNNANEKTSISYPNGTGELFTYDAAGHVLTARAGKMSNGQISTTYASYSYSYMNGSTPTDLLQKVSLLDPVGHSATYSRDYSYDTMNRLTNAEVYNNGTEVQDWSYSYDKAGNRTQSSVLSTGVSTTYSYNAAEELTRTVQGSTTVSYSYDGNGNLTSSTDGNSFSYNKKNQTTAIDGNSYSYSGPDQTERVTLNSTSDSYSGLGLSYETTSGNITYYTRCSCGMLLNERLPSGGKYYYLFDGQESVVGLTDSNGNEVNAYDYDPYGVLLNTATNPVTNPFQYEGGYFESSTGLVKFGTRYYNPNLGRWTQQDPVIGNLYNPDTLNRYLYVSDDPVNEVDPSGKDIFECALAIALLIVGIIGGFVPIIAAILTGVWIIVVSLLIVAGG